MVNSEFFEFGKNEGHISGLHIRFSHKRLIFSLRTRTFLKVNYLMKSPLFNG